MAFEFDANSARPEDQFDPTTAKPEKPAGALRKLGDLGLSAAKGVIAVPEAAVGLADIATGGRAGKAVEGLGVRFKDAKDVLTGLQSEDLKGKQQQFSEADGVIDKAGVALRNPSLIANSVAESIPLMGAGAVPARALLAAAPRVGAAGAGAIGEGLAGAGSAAEGIRQETPDGLMTGTQAGLAGASGALTAGFGALGGKLAQRLGIADVDTALARGSAEVAAGANPKNFLRRGAEGAVSEGLLEELPQSLSEQSLQNIALDKPVGEGMADAAVMGTLAGGVMGAGAGIATRNPPQPKPEDDKTGGLTLAGDQPPEAAPVLDPATGGVIQKTYDPRDPNSRPPLAIMPKPEGIDYPEQVKPSARMGIDPAAGPISSAAALAVDSGAHQTELFKQAEQAAIENEAKKPDSKGTTARTQTKDSAKSAFKSYEEAQSYITEQKQRGTSVQALPLPQKDGSYSMAMKGTPDYTIAEFHKKQMDMKAAGVLDGDILTKSGDIFAKKAPAVSQANKAGAGHVVVPVQGGFVIRKQEVSNVSQPTTVSPGAGASVSTGSADGVRGVVSGAGTGVGDGVQPVRPEADNVGAADKLPAGVSDSAVEKNSPVSNRRNQPALDTNAQAATETIANVQNQAPRDTNPSRDPTPYPKRAAGVDKAEATPEAGAKTPDTAVPTAGSGSVQAVDEAAHSAATSPLNDLPQPTDAQKKAGNYAKGHVMLGGLDLSIENPAGSVRSGKDKTGKAWSNTLQHHYGYIKGTMGNDKDHVDLFVKPETPLDYSGDVFVIDQVHPESGKFDEHKVMVGFPNAMAAKAAYHKNYAKGWKGMKAMTPMPFSEFKAWVKDGPKNKPLAPESIVQPATKTVAQPTEKTSDQAPKAEQSQTQPEAGKTATDIQPAAGPGVGNAQQAGDEPAGKPVKTPFSESPYFAAGKVDHAAGKPRVLPSYFTKPSINSRAWYAGWDAANIAAPVAAKPDTQRITTDKAEMRPYRKPDGSVGYEAVPIEPKAEAVPADKPGVVKVPSTVADAISAQMQKQKGRITRLKNEAEKAGSLEDKRAAQLKVTAAEATLRQMRLKIFDAEDAAVKAVESGDAKAFTDFEDLFPSAAEEIAKLTGQNDELDAEMQSYEAKKNPTYSGAPAIRQKLETIAQRLGFSVNKSQTGWHASGGMISIPSEDADLSSAVSADHVFAHELGHGIMDKRGVSVKGFPDVELRKRVANWDELVAASKEFRPGVHNHTSDSARKHAKKANEIAADAIASVLIGDKPLTMLQPFMDWLGINKVDLGLQTVAEANAESRAAKVSETKAPQAPADTAPVATETVAKDDAKAALSEKEKAAKAKMFNALGKLAHLASKNTRMNWTPEEEQQLLPIVIELFDGAMELGAVTFQKAVAYVRDFISKGIDQETADAIPFETLQGAYIATSGRHKDKGVTPKKEVAGFESLAELEIVEENADTVGKDEPNADPGPTPASEPVTGSTGVQDGKPGKLRKNAGSVRRGDAKSNTGNVSRGTVKGAPPDFVAAPGGLTREGSWFETAKRNLDLIDLAIKIDAEKRAATPEEQAQLAKYVGFGASAIRNELFPVPPAYAKAQEPNRLIWPQYVRNDRFKPLAERMEALPREWQQSILQSSQYAHYTSEGIIRSIWSALGRMGFKGGQIFEPGMGIGSFSMLMPDSVRADSRYTGVEFDSPTALIAKLLSPQQNMLHGDFIKGKYPKNFFDVNVGNPPFSQTKIFGDPEYAKKGFMLHDFFFAKGIDLVRPGGIQVFVTSKGTMDKQNDKARKYLADRADLLGVIRLPSTAFEDNAGTSVVTDVIFLKKREPGAPAAGEAWAGTATVDTPDGPVVVNEYFAKHPEMVLGQQRISGNTDDQGRRINSNGMGGEKYTVVSYDTTPAELDAKFATAIEKLPKGAYSEKKEDTVAKKDARVDFDPTVKREGVVYLGKDGSLMRVSEGVGVPLANDTKLSDKDQAWFKSYVGLRDLVQEARFQQLNEGDWEAALAKLNKAYDKFVKDHGHILDYRVMVRKSTDEEGNVVETEHRIPKNRRLLREDYDQALVTSLESISEDGSIVKSPFLKSRTIGKPVTRKVTSIGDALAVSLDETGALNVKDVGDRLGLSESEAIEALDKQIYQTPTGQWQLSDEYLSGDVVSKLEEAEAAARINPDLRRNVEALKDAQPEKLGPSQISAKLGASWVPESHVNAFAQEIDSGEVSFDPRTETWQVDGGNLRNQRKAGAEYGTAKRSPSELLEAILNSRSITVKYDSSAGKELAGKTDVEATTAANEAAKKIKEKFKGWVWTDTDRATELVELYNKHFNNIAPRKFDGSHLTLPGVSLRYKLHPHQLRAIWRMVQTGNTYLAHAVGAGKTIEMIAGGMEQKRLGLIKKPIYVVPNHMLEQFSNEFMELYPLANIMVADDENFSAERRKAFVASATLNSPDAIVITHDAFQRIGVKEESVAPIRDEILSDLEIELSETAKGNDTRVRRGQLEQQIEAVKQRFDRIIGAGAKDSTVKFEDMGVDFVFADEAHVFRKLDFHTAQQIKGIDPNGSKRALDMYVKTRILESRKPGRSMAFASGTPVTNTMGELYTIMRFFAGAELDKSGISTFDAWARQFGEVAPALEPNAAGKYELIERFAKFDNVPELMSRVRQFMDVLTSDNLGALVKRPDIEGGKPNLNIIPTNDSLTAYMKGELARRIDISRAWKPSKDEPFNPDPIVAIITDGRFAAIDPRFFGGKLNEGDQSIITEMGDRIAKVYHETKNEVYKGRDGKDEPIKGSTQIVFYNLGFGEQSQKSRGFNSRHAFTKRLTDGGIPRAEIAWFDDANSDAKKEAVFKDMRSGKVKVLIGSAKKMGTGVNVQKRLKVLHYQDPPWFPADVEQPHGRILRQGNQNEKIGIEWYTTKGTYQSTMWQMVGRKQRFIDQAFTGDKNMRSMDDLGEASLFEQAAAVASGDPRAIQLAGLRQDVQRFERLQAAHTNEQINVQHSLRSASWHVESLQKKIKGLETAFKAIGERYFAFTAGKVGGREYIKPGEFGQAVKDAFNKVAADAVMAADLVREKEIASIGNAIKITMDSNVNRDGKADGTYDLFVEFGGQQYELSNAAAMGADVDAAGLARRIFNKINGVDSDLQSARRSLASEQTDQIKLRKKLGAPFEYQQEMAEKYGELKRLEAELKAEGEAVPPPAPLVINADGTTNGEAPDPANLKYPPGRYLVTNEKGIAEDAPRELSGDDIDQLLRHGSTIDPANPGETPAFSRSFSPAARSQATDVVERQVARIKSKWKNAPKIIVAFDMADERIPAAVRAEDQRQRSGGAAGTPEGFYYGGTVYLMSSQLKSPGDVQRVLFHETLGHFGLRGTFGDGLKPILQQIATFRKAEVDAKIKEYGLRSVPDLDRLIAAEEVLAEMAQNTPEIGFVKRAIAMIRTWLRENGFSNLTLTDDEIITQLILPARAFVEQGGKPKNTGGNSLMRSLKKGDWYSELSRQVMANKQQQMPAGMWASWIDSLKTKGVKPDEIEWSGVTDWLKMQPGKVTKQQVLAYLDANGVQVQEVTLGGDGFYRDANGERVFDDETGDYIGSKNPGTKYENYTLPGGQNYREVLLTLPVDTSESAEFVAAKARLRRALDAEREAGSDVVNRGDLTDETDAAQRIVDRLRAENESKPRGYKSSHWDQPNVIAHIRLNDRTDADGNRVLFVEEIQSDWGQDGKKKGFTKDTTGWTAKSLAKPGQTFGNWNVFDANGERVTSIVGGSVTDGAGAIRKAAEGIPLAPFVTSTDKWLTLSLKRIVKMAVDGGYAKVAFINGEQSAERYSLAKHIRTLKVKPLRGGGMYAVGSVLHGGESRAITTGEGVPAENLPDLVGKEMAERILADKLTPGEWHDYSDLDLKVGGEGMKAFYDAIVPNTVNALLKKVGGGKVETVDVGKYHLENRQGGIYGEYATRKDAEKAAMQREASVPLGWAVVGGNQPGFTITPAMQEKAAGGMPMFSRSTDAIGETLNTAANNVRAVKLPAGYLVGDLINSAPGKLSWWHKTVGTQYNLAQRSAPFKRVFDSVQNFINDVSYFATEAADLAPNILPKLETWKDIVKSPLSAEDTKAISAPIFEGTLTWARDESGKPIKMEDLEKQAKDLTVDQKSQRLLRGDHITDQVLKMWRGLPKEQYDAIIEGKFERDVLKAGIVWTDAELKAMFKLTDKQIPLYREFREATDKSLANLAVSDMLRFGGEDVKAVKDQAMAAPTVGKAAEILRDHLMELADLIPERNDLLLDTANKMIEKGDKAQDLMDRGYAPLSRFGQYTLDVVHNGERVYFGMFENKFDAAKMNRQMQAEFPGANITQGTVSEQAYKMFAGVSPETLELFGDMLGLEAQGDSAAAQAFQTYLKLTKSTRSSMKRLIQRKGIAGFNEDAGRVLAGFVYSNARQTASNLHMGEMSQAANDVAQQEGELKDAAIKLVDYIKNPQEEAQQIRGLLFAQYIGGSIASAMVNITQPLTMTFPWLSQYGGATGAAKQMTAAVKDVSKKRTGDIKLDAALHRAEEDGTVSPQEVHQLMRQAQGGGALRSGDGTKAGNALANVQNTVSRFSLAWGKLFSAAEQFNRRVTFIAAYRTAVEQKMADPDAFARKAIAETQGVYNKGNKPAWARGAIGSTLFTFKQYSISYMEMLSRMAKNGPEGKKAALLALGVLFLMAGAGGAPGADDMDDLISGILQSMGYNFDSKARRKEFFVSLFGEGGAQFVEHGVSGLPGVPIDVSGRMGLGNLIPGTGLFTKKADHTRDVAEIAGPAGDLVKRGFDAAGKLIQGDLLGHSGAVATMAPKAMQNLYQAFDMASMGMYRDMNGKKVLDTDEYDALAKAIGFQPTDVKKVQEASFEAQRMIGLNKMRETEIANQWALGLFERDQDKVQSAKEQLRQWNEDNPESPIRIKFGQIVQRVKKMNESKTERIAKTAPKEIRAAVRRELESI